MNFWIYTVFFYVFVDCFYCFCWLFHNDRYYVTGDKTMYIFSLMRFMDFYFRGMRGIEIWISDSNAWLAQILLSLFFLHKTSVCYWSVLMQVATLIWSCTEFVDGILITDSGYLELWTIGLSVSSSKVSWKSSNESKVFN